jgi:hypothetical protein
MFSKILPITNHSTISVLRVAQDTNDHLQLFTFNSIRSQSIARTYVHSVMTEAHTMAEMVGAHNALVWAGDGAALRSLADVQKEDIDSNDELVKSARLH